MRQFRLLWQPLLRHAFSLTHFSSTPRDIPSQPISDFPFSLRATIPLCPLPVPQTPLASHQIHRARFAFPFFVAKSRGVDRLAD